MAPLPPDDRAAIEALADTLSASANTLHRRLLRALRQPPGLAQAEAQTMFDQEVALRQRANSLYLSAARLAAAGLGGLGQQLREASERAKVQIEQIEKLKGMLAIVGELLTLGAALAAGKPEQMLAPMEKIKHQLDALPPSA
ncbi:hypothetical protein HSX11_00265 [Oxalobacteraceae bacterium]|nr:hypothetical protein [Oxalobacteraceae bacterium]